ncbi:GNAT family N-acetyltransferase [uncultured Methylobacterium sp.]|uniref:GNAT family N-acetyltransferase n=1 Tax=uncultured Methylobacterium sp. TaxID=157278 RepID=UPI0035CC2683
MLTIRTAEPDDLKEIVALYAADELGGHGDAWTPDTEAGYRAGFAAIAASADTSLHVALEDGAVVGVFQLVLFTTLVERGARRAKLASVQVRSDCRSRGIGARMIAEAERIAHARGAVVLELTSSKRRRDAHRFYDRLGYERSHEGFRKRLCEGL